MRPVLSKLVGTSCVTRHIGSNLEPRVPCARLAEFVSKGSAASARKLLEMAMPPAGRGTEHQTM